MQNQKFRLRNNFILNILFSFSSSVLALFGFLAVLPPASEPEASAIIDGEQFALTVTNSDSLSLNINPTDAGSIAIAKDTITANTNSPAGYKLYVSTDSTTSNNIHLNGRESNDTEDKKLVATTGTNELPTALENNSWGFAIAGASNFDTTYSIDSPSSSAKFAAVPQKDTEQLIHDHSGRATDDETEIYFAAKADTNIASGNYSTTILYTTLSEATDQDVTEINLENVAFPTNYETATVTMNTSILSSKTPTITVKVGTADATNIVITNNAPLSLTFDLPANLTEGTYDITLNITNLAKSYTKEKVLGVYKSMQEMTPELCESMTLEEQKQFMDTRDNKVYFVAKLADGNCWMTQNLDYDLSVAENQTLTPETSNVAEDRTVTPVSWGTDYDSIYYMDGGDIYYANGITKTGGYSNLPADSVNRHYAQGDYYSWKAVTAGVATIGITNADVNESICPAGWRLPTGNSADTNYSFGNLVKQYGYSGSSQPSGVTDSALLTSPLFFAQGGDIYSGSLFYQGSYGYYWSSRASSNGYIAYGFYFGNSFVEPGNHYDRISGFSVRCVAQAKDLNSISTMQEMTPEIVAKTSVDTSKQLTDTRDGKKYWVTKLKDGNIWMTQNLDLDLSTTTTLTPADSDVTVDWTPSRATIAGAANISSYINDNDTPYSFDPGNYYFDGTYYSSAECNYLTTTCDHFATTPYNLNGEHGHVGNYYNWSAAVASNDTSTTTAGTDMSSSICPAGWRLPHGHQSAQGNDFATLNTAYGGATNSDSVLLANPLFFVRGGYVNSGLLRYSANYGLYWSSTAYFATSAADYLYFYSGGVNPSGDNYHRNGYSVRCLAHKQTQTLTIKDQSDDSVIATYNFETSYKLPKAPAKEGYAFLGYDEDKNATTATYNIGGLVNQSKTLYVIYGEETYLHMQNVASWKDTLELEQQIQVRDTRDDKIYWVSKLKDGNIWMTQNLDYDLSVAANQTLVPSTSNVTTTRTVTPVLWGTDKNSIYYMDGGDNYLANGITQTAGLSSLPADSTDRHYAQGDYYSWKAATAGQGTTSITNADVNESICPAGWRLPASNLADVNYSFGNLVKQYGYTGENQSGTTDATLLASPLFFARGGYVYSGSLSDQGSNGRYWSSRAATSISVAGYYLYFNSSYVRPSYDSSRNYGFSVRCVAL